eukprot:TRINITY_DN4716_c0_g1_i1.p1 TRINITY_DN4716_c0_g1~~TRINITY_DN4716_c0_g1_i1.p1  ORF type:complete len:786 (-),score=134.51 TRINITY_DN4716_c0_g1_i1:329-2686(-)
MPFIPEVPCRFKAYGCDEKIQVNEIREHVRLCKCHPRKVCPKLPTTREGQLIWQAYILPALLEKQPDGTPWQAREAWDAYLRGTLVREGCKGAQSSLNHYWFLAFSLPLASSETILPGFLRIMGEGYAYDAEEEHGGSTAEAWAIVKEALHLAQGRYHDDLRQAARQDDEADAARLIEKLGLGLNAVARQSLLSAESSRLFMDLPRPVCIALDHLQNERHGLDKSTLQAAIQGWNADVEATALADIQKLLQHSAPIRICDLQHSGLHPAVRKNSELFMHKKQREGRSPKQAVRLLRLEFQKCPWVTRREVDQLVADLKGREYALPSQPTPNYWTPLASLPGYSFHLVPLPEADLAAFQMIFDSSWRSKVTKDRKTKLADRFVVTKVERIENERAWSEYAVRRDQIAAERWANGSCPEISGVKLDRSLLPGQTEFADALAGAQELFLFHGTNRRAAMDIALNDFSTEFSSELGLFGAGLYFAESVSKSDEYCRDEGASQDRTMLICRVCMGNHRVLSDVTFDIKEVLRELEKKGYHSLLGDRENARGTYREFISYDGSAAYAEYIVSYRRFFGSEAVTLREEAQKKYAEHAEARLASFEAALEAARSAHAESARTNLSDAELCEGEQSGMQDVIWGYAASDLQQSLRVDFIQDPGDITFWPDGKDKWMGESALASKPGRLECPACNKEFQSRQQLKRHLVAYANNDSTGAHRQALDQFVGEHGDTICLECPACNKEFQSRQQLKRHLVAYANNDSTGAHRQALDQFVGEHGDTTGRAGTDSCCNLL